MLSMYITILLATGMTFTMADYECLCNYHVATPVYSIPNNSSRVIGHMNEFDCKPSYTTVASTSSRNWLAIQFEGKVRKRILSITSAHARTVDCHVQFSSYYYLSPGIRKNAIRGYSRTSVARTLMARLP